MPYRPTERTRARAADARDRILRAAHDQLAEGGYAATVDLLRTATLPVGIQAYNDIVAFGVAAVIRIRIGMLVSSQRPRIVAESSTHCP